jgi:hypothetical protein
VTVEYLDLADYVAVAAEVTAIDVATVMKVANLDLADSALHAPAAGFEGRPSSTPRTRCRAARA